MEEIILLDAAERYLNGEMTAQEKSFFEDLRRNNQEVDQLVVEHHLFLNQMGSYSVQKEFKALLSDTHNRLLEDGTIKQGQPATGGVVIRLWKKHKRTIAVAASIACVTALTISGMLSYFSPKDNAAANELDKLNKKVSKIEKTQDVQTQRIRQINGAISKTPTDDMQQSSAGTSFLIDTKGYLITNSHVINNSSLLQVINNGKEYFAKTVFDDPQNDLAILKIEDPEFTSPANLPYSIRKTGIELGEEIFTLGYPRNEIVYGKGYLSAQSGFNDDTLSVQISVTANPGNSGGPVLDKNGDVIGILNSREKNADGVVFANKANNIIKLIEKLKDQDTSYQSLKLPASNLIKGKERTQQIKQIKDCVFMVKAYSK